MSKLAQDIKKIKAAIASPATPDNIKQTMKKKLVELEEKLASESKQPEIEVGQQWKSAPDGTAMKKAGVRYEITDISNGNVTLKVPGDSSIHGTEILALAVLKRLIEDGEMLFIAGPLEISSAKKEEQPDNAKKYTLHYGGQKNMILSEWHPNDIEYLEIIDFVDLNKKAKYVSYYTFSSWKEANDRVIDMVINIYSEQNRWGKKTTEKVLDTLKSLTFFENDKNTFRNMFETVTDKWSELSSGKPDNAKKPDLPARKNDEDDLDCEDLIAKAKASAAKRKASREKADKKPESKKNVERVEKAAETVVSSIEKRMEAGEKVNASEIEKLITEYEANITELKRLLAKLK